MYKPRSLYQCVRRGDHWHLTQEQATPPPKYASGAWTSCGIWAHLVLGYERRVPDCAECLTHVEKYETQTAVPSTERTPHDPG